MTIRELIGRIEELNKQLEKGNLSTDEVVEMTDITRDLYERLVVIRHRSYEELLGEDRTFSDEEEKDSNRDCKEMVEEPKAMEHPSIPVGKAAVPPNQISLIDSIEEIKRMETSLNEKFKEEESSSLGRKLQNQPIDDLPGAIGINQRFRFINKLFQDDQSAFNEAVGKLNSFTSFIEADEYVRNTLKERFDWQLKDPVVKEMLDLVERRYL